MTTETDKLVRIAASSGAALDDSLGCYRFSEAALAAFRAAIIADLCGDVEPVALAVVHEKEPLELFCNSSYVDFLPGEYNLYPASAVAAIAAERDALLTALEDLASEAVEIWEYPADYPQIEHANELIAKHKAALTKGQQ